MASEDLIRQEEMLIEIVEKHVWNNLRNIRHVPYGYKTRDKISQKARNILELFSIEDNPTARHIRRAPRAFIVQQKPQVLYLVDYKCMTVPICDDLIIDVVSQNANRRVEADDIGKFHTSFYDNYVALKDLDVKVAILTYIADHPRLLLCDFIENIEALDPYEVGNEQTDRNVEPFVFFDVTQMRTLEEFLADTHGQTVASNIAPQIQKARIELRQEFPTNHHPRSP